MKHAASARLYSHQREAWAHVGGGHDTVIVTPTASGKTLCYNLPVIDGALKTGAKALYLFPTKALSQDQVSEILELNAAGQLGIRAYTFDGDTPGDARRAVRTHGDIVVSNPDMLHQAILPHHTKWAQFFEALRFVVIDELHTYRGVFGSHVANLVRRLRRICRFYRTDPVFIACSATIANPAELAERLLGGPVRAVTESGAPQGRKHFLVWNPPVLNADLGIRVSARSQSTRIARLAVKLGLKTIVFANSRLEVEVLTKYLKDVFDRDPRTPARVAAYRGGYLPTERRDKEARLRAGGLDCVVSTSALELGVDIGALDVCVLNGYPGTVAGSLQRFGRAGRRNRTAVGVLVCTSDPLDQYLARHPDFFLGASPEHARIDPDQLLILMDHVRCAAFELPFTEGETFGGVKLEEALGYLAEQGVVHREGPRWHWIADSYPANAVSLRSIAEGNFTVIDISNGRKDVIAEVDYSAAAVTLYEGAIHMVQSAPWQVERLDWTGRKAFVRTTAADYYTDAIDYTKLKVLDEFAAERGPASVAAHGEVHVIRRVAGYKKIRYYTHENVGYGPRGPAGPGDAYDGAMVGSRSAGAEARVRDAVRGARRVPRGGARDPSDRGVSLARRTAGHRTRGRRRRARGKLGRGRREATVVRKRGRSKARRSISRQGCSRSGRRCISTTTTPVESESPRRFTTCANRSSIGRSSSSPDAPASSAARRALVRSSLPRPGEGSRRSRRR